MDVRSWLIQNGIPAEELDRIVEPPVLNHIGEGLTLALQSADNLGLMFVQMMMRIDDLESRIATLEGGQPE